MNLLIGFCELSGVLWQMLEKDMPIGASKDSVDG